MPLAFPSLSHGTVAFGFFNIESDMLLLQELFFFADRFCEAVERLAGGEDRAELPGWRIPDPRAVGDLHGAIAGVHLTGFIGETYRRWPFPARPEGFRQSPEGHAHQDEVRAMIQPFGQAETFPVERSTPYQVGIAARTPYQVGIAEYRFDRPGFDRLVAYVDRGGHPRWRDDRRPAYVQRMVEAWRGQAVGHGI